MFDIVTLTQIGRLLLYLLIPILSLYIAYLLITNAFRDMGFSSLEAIIIVFISFLLGSAIIDEFVGIPFSNIPLFTYGSWNVGINTGGAIIPILLSIYLIIKNKIPTKKIIPPIILVAAITFFVTYPDPETGIVSYFPFWLFPVFSASILSAILFRKNYSKAAPVAYIAGTIGVLIGADFFHLPILLGFTLESSKNAIIGGANVFDMIFITGILAVIVDGILMYNQRQKTIS